MSTTITLDTTGIEFVVFTGYYGPNEQDTTPQQHTQLTLSLYNTGLELGNQKRESVNDTLDVYEGVAIEDGKAFAQWYSETTGKTQHFEIQ